MEIRGGAVYVRLGGGATITGCFFTVNPVLIREFLYTPDVAVTLRLLGGYLLQEGGAIIVCVLRLTWVACMGLVCATDR